MYKYRITKYDPSFRDEEGRYLKDDWIAISDIGKTFDGEKLTIEGYQKTEDCYINAIHLVMNYLNVPYLTINDVTQTFSFEMLLNIIKKYRELYTEKMLKYYSNVKNNENLNKENIDFLCRFLLREDIHAMVFYPRKMKVFIGYDYLMGIYTSRPLDPIIPLIEEMGLFIEDFSN
ncbi:hypothetical protein MHH81_12350 [Psychrobacillus sp. FSL H8-0484]|uniref:hypothetical protein n=1 Tax=Psychrobacillus sp. FSL H8-0484 TaxID=2921390 RepID=UPI0030FA7D2F